MLLEPEMEQFLHSGCALIIGLVATDGEPYASADGGSQSWTTTALRSRPR